MVLFVVGLPLVPLPTVPPDQFDIVTSDGGIEFENPRERSIREAADKASV
jgi:hypothetical protein